MVHVLQLSAVACQKTSTGSAVAGSVILLALIGGVVALAVANAGARRRLAVAHSGLAMLETENERLHHLVASRGALAPTAGPPPIFASETHTPSRWHPDPSGRHELRWWDGTAWGDHVSDGGIVSSDPAR